MKIWRCGHSLENFCMCLYKGHTISLIRLNLWMIPDVVLPTHYTRFVTVTFGLSLFTVHIPSHSMPVSLSESKSFEIEHVVNDLTLTPPFRFIHPFACFPHFRWLQSHKSCNVEVVLWNRWHGPTLIGSFGLSLWVSLSWRLSGDPNVNDDQLRALTNITNLLFFRNVCTKIFHTGRDQFETGTLFCQSHSVW